MGVPGNPHRNATPRDVRDWEGDPAAVVVHTAGRDLKKVEGTIRGIEDASESRYRWHLAIEFENPIWLSSVNVT